MQVYPSSQRLSPSSYPAYSSSHDLNIHSAALAFYSCIDDQLGFSMGMETKAVSREEAEETVSMFQFNQMGRDP
jgi:hypothetical protein